MHTIHCHFCGGVVPSRAKVEYRPPRSSAQVALPQQSICTCTPPIVYEDSPFDHERVQRVEPVERHEREAPARPPDRSDPWKGAV